MVLCSVVRSQVMKQIYVQMRQNISAVADRRVHTLTFYILQYKEEMGLTSTVKRGGLKLEYRRIMSEILHYYMVEIPIIRDAKT